MWSVFQPPALQGAFIRRSTSWIGRFAGEYCAHIWSTTHTADVTLTAHISTIQRVTSSSISLIDRRRDGHGRREVCCQMQKGKNRQTNQLIFWKLREGLAHWASVCLIIQGTWTHFEPKILVQYNERTCLSNFAFVCDVVWLPTFKLDSICNFWHDNNAYCWEYLHFYQIILFPEGGSSHTPAATNAPTWVR